MKSIFNSMLFISTIFFMTACGSEPASDNENSSDNDGGLNITIENDDGEKSNITIDLDDLENIDFSKAEGKLEEAMEAIKNAVNESVNDGEKVETMNFRDLKAILPNRLLGMDRISHSGEKNGIMGMSISQANAKYKDGDKSLEVDVMDSAGMGIAKLGGIAWSTLDIDKESDDGYERTTEIDGYKAFENWNSKTGKSELTWMYKDRYVISFKGRGLDADDLQRARKKIDYDDLD